MEYVGYLVSRILKETETKREKNSLSDSIISRLDTSWDDWEKDKKSLTEEEEKTSFIKRMSQQGFRGSTYEEALCFLDKEFPGNVRRKNDEKRFKKLG